jgi:cytochrome c
MHSCDNTNYKEMKRTLVILGCLTLAMASCAGDASKSSEDSNATTETTTTTESTSPMLPGEKLIATADCIGCHNKTQKVVGPAYVDVAKKIRIKRQKC